MTTKLKLEKDPAVEAVRRRLRVARVPKVSHEKMATSLVAKIQSTEYSADEQTTLLTNAFQKVATAAVRSLREDRAKWKARAV